MSFGGERARGQHFAKGFKGRNISPLLSCNDTALPLRCRFNQHAYRCPTKKDASPAFSHSIISLLRLFISLCSLHADIFFFKRAHVSLNYIQPLTKLRPFSYIHTFSQLHTYLLVYNQVEAQKTPLMPSISISSIQVSSHVCVTGPHANSLPHQATI